LSIFKTFPHTRSDAGLFLPGSITLPYYGILASDKTVADIADELMSTSGRHVGI
jgi:hypothetical protein